MKFYIEERPMDGRPVAYRGSYGSYELAVEEAIEPYGLSNLSKLVLEVGGVAHLEELAVSVRIVDESALSPRWVAERLTWLTIRSFDGVEHGLVGEFYRVKEDAGKFGGYSAGDIMQPIIVSPRWSNGGGGFNHRTMCYYLDTEASFVGIRQELLERIGTAEDIMRRWQ